MAAYISFQPSDFFNPLLYSGTGSSNAVTGVGFQPDMVWIKSYDTAVDHALYDAPRGVEEVIYPNLDSAGGTASTGLTAFGADGFTVVSEGNVNNGSREYVSWNWKGGTTSGITTNGSTTITPSAYSFNQTSGFSILKYVGNTTSGAKVAHGLGATPKMIIVKNYDAAENWGVYHSSIGNTKYLKLDTNHATTTSTTAWNDTDPDSVNFTLGNSGAFNGTTMVAYCFAEKKGYSQIGQYTGNGNADGTFVYTGFRPAWILIKRTNGTLNWMLYDSKRTGINQENAYLEPSTTQEEYLTVDIDILSNGFKIRDTATSVNGTPDPYAYAAFAEFPFVSSNDVPTVAR